MGPVFIKDLAGAGHDYYIFCDHLGTPLAYKNTTTGQIYVNPASPWGESLANAPTRGSPYTNQNFERPPDAIFPTVPLGLAGHLHDADTGLIYMHHRYYDPQLGHFLNPDFRAPDIYDPSTFTEPYAYASGNPMMFWDPDGLKVNKGGIKDRERVISFLEELAKLTGLELDRVSVEGYFNVGFVKSTADENSLWIDDKGDVGVGVKKESGSSFFYG